MSDIFDDLNAMTLSAIGDPITYTQAGGSALQIKAWIDHSNETIDFGVSAGVTFDATAQVLKSDVPTPNKAGDRIALPRTGLTYRLASEPLHSRCGRMWNLVLVKTTI